MFILFISDIYEISDISQFNSFVDDTNIFLCWKKIHDSFWKFTQEMIELRTCLMESSLKKTKFGGIGTYKTSLRQLYKLGKKSNRET